MKNAAGQFVTWLGKSMEAIQAGASARKLTALAVVILVVVSRIAWIRYAAKNDKFDLLESLTIIDYSFIAGLLGLTTWQYIKQTQGGKDAEVKQEEKKDEQNG